MWSGVVTVPIDLTVLPKSPCLTLQGYGNEGRQRIEDKSLYAPSPATILFLFHAKADRL
jgi:hypothetical protein